MKKINNYLLRLSFLLIIASIFSCDKDNDLVYDYLNYDGDSQDAVFLPSGTFEPSVRFNANSVSNFLEQKLVKIEYYVAIIPDVCELRIYKGSDANTPLNLIYKKNVLNEISKNSWNTHTIADIIPITNEDLWISLYIEHQDGQRTIGCDNGPAATNGDWIWDDISSWGRLRDRLDVDINWNIRALIEKK